MSSQTTATDSSYLRLNGAQQTLRDEYLAHDSGLFVMNAVPGAGKSVTVADLAAREILQGFYAGDPAPEQTVSVLSFNAEQADELGPKIADRLRALVEHEATRAAAAITDEALAALTRRIRQSDAIGTVDSLLREIFSDLIGAVGFEEMPAVGDELHLDDLHSSIYEALTETEAVAEELDHLTEAYPAGDYVDGAPELLKRGMKICRQQRLSTNEFRDRLLATVKSVYPEGPPEEPSDLTKTLHRVLDDEPAADLDDSLTTTETKAVIKADTTLYEGWHTTIEAYATVLEEYRERYREAIRERSILSHTDVASLVARFLDGSHPAAEDHTRLRDRVLGRYRHRLQSLIIDEAQDISTIQHDALSPLVEPDTRVFLAGDLRQSIYVWRDARPSLFAQAIEDGQYFGRDWQTHVTETTQTTYRARPDIAQAIDAICEPALTDDQRGNLAEFEIEYPRLSPNREPIEGPNVHIAGFDSPGSPGSPWYVDDSGRGEAPALAAKIATGLRDGTFEGEDEGEPTVLVLFRWRTHMDTYRQAFEDQGLTVANAASYLFAAPSTEIVLDVLDWLTTPFSAEALRTLVRKSALDIEHAEPALAQASWSLTDLLTSASNTEGLDADTRAVLGHLQDLQRQAPTLRQQPVPSVIRTIIDTLALRADTYNLISTDPDQRVANCDALVDYVQEATSDVEIGLDELFERLDRIREDPYTGPSQPLPDTDAEVVFKTIHQAKGEEAAVVALADPAFPLHKHGPAGQRLVAAPGVFALAPPAETAGHLQTQTGEIFDLRPEYGGLYTPSEEQDPNTSGIFPVEGGLRWVSERWRGSGFVGHDRLQRAVSETRAESWRLLYVALTRARDHLVLPLPWAAQTKLQPRDRWRDTLIEGLGFEAVDGPGPYALDAPSGSAGPDSVPIGVSDADGLQVPQPEAQAESASPLATRGPVAPETLPTLSPRFIRPSTLKPLTEDFEGTILAHLQNRPLHTETDGIDLDLPLVIDAMDTEAIGKVCHRVVTQAIDAGLDAQALRESDPAVEGIIETALDVHGPPASQAEREGLRAFLEEYVLSDLVDSELWVAVQQAQAVYTEVPVRGEFALDGTPVEVDGQADLVVQQPDGSWEVLDLKVALTEPNTALKDRYRTQVGLYADLVERLVDGSVEGRIETLGVTDA